MSATHRQYTALLYSWRGRRAHWSHSLKRMHEIMFWGIGWGSKRFIRMAFSVFAGHALPTTLIHTPRDVERERESEICKFWLLVAFVVVSYEIHNGEAAMVKATRLYTYTDFWNVQIRHCRRRWWWWCQCCYRRHHVIVVALVSLQINPLRFHDWMAECAYVLCTIEPYFRRKSDPVVVDCGGGLRALRKFVVSLLKTF